MIKFNKFHVTNGTDKVKVHYSLDGRTDGQKCVTIYSKEYGHTLGYIIPQNYRNESDMMTDYFEKGRVNLFEGDELYSEARNRVESFIK